MAIAKTIARKVIFPALMNIKADALIRNLGNKSILNVMYHGVVDKDSTYFSPRHITKEQFEQHLIYYKKNFDVISLKEAFEMVQNNQRPKRKTITLSFDDGFKNNLTTALPLLEKYDMKTTFFICGVCQEDMKIQTLWSEVVGALNFFYKNQVIEFGDKKFINLLEPVTGLHIYDYVKTSHPADRDLFLEQCVDKYQIKEKLESIPEEVWRLMNGKELIEFASSHVVDIASHGYLHYNLGNIELNKAVEDMERSKSVLEKLLGKNIDMIAYPDGSYTDQVKDEAEKIGYKYQLAVIYKSPGDKMDPRILNRHGISSTTTFESNMFMLNKAFQSKGI